MSTLPPENTTGSRDTSGEKVTGCLLLGLFPFLLVGSIFIGGALEEGGSKHAGWLWIPSSVLVMLAFGVFRYRAGAAGRHRPHSFPALARSVMGFVGMQLLVLILLGLVAMGLMYFFSPFSGMGDNR
ncbi:hypothetical protein JIN84_00270 [Luteolibacter yonseiensis]|uniref:Uncharacterized protein n=1 Tax=Luteolibacter yonseiensis TaxID=1144680 RepID=A0A934V9Q6_9BACT|nr:hypothetical protein [Luteolibacter yonseiensis]MBK1814041.1 hypothetical protein [Luteolibacter yonseiensis]